VDGTIRQWEIDNTFNVEFLMKGHQSNVTSLEIDVKNNRLFSGSADTQIKIWDLKMHQCVQTIMAHDHIISTLCWAKIDSN